MEWLSCLGCARLPDICFSEPCVALVLLVREASRCVFGLATCFFSASPRIYEAIAAELLGHLAVHGVEIGSACVKN